MKTKADKNVASRYPKGDSTREQHAVIVEALGKLGHGDRKARLAELSRVLGRDVPAFAALSFVEAEMAIIELAVQLGRKSRDAG